MTLPPLSETEIAQFFEYEADHRSRLQKVEAAATIKEHGPQFEAYILNHERRCHLEYAQRCREIMEKYRDAPVGASYREDRHSVQSFRFSSDLGRSLSLVADGRTYRAIGCAIGAIVIAGTLWCGIAAYRYLDDIVTLREEQVKTGSQMMDIDK